MNELLNIAGLMLLWQKSPENELLLRSEKIYSVLTILLIIFGVLIAYLIISQRKIKQLERKIEDIKVQEGL